MSVPVFEEYEPETDCGCPGCAQRRRDLAMGLPLRAGGHPSAHGARRALVLVTAAGVVLGGGGAGAAATPAGPYRADSADRTGRPDRPDPAARERVDPQPDTPQGGSGPLHGRPSRGPQGAQGPASQSLRRTTRADIINRAKRWVNAPVPYSMEKYWTDGYRQDCSGFVSMAWGLPSNEWTGTLARYATRMSRTELQPGDILLFHNPADPTKGSHVTIFGGWTDYTRTAYVAYEQAKPRTRKQATPMAYWNNSARYVAYRYKGLTGQNSGAGGSASSVKRFPGRTSFGPGANNAYVTQLGRMLVERGGSRFYEAGPGPRWSEADRRATRAFQKAQGWTGPDADGLPGPSTWRLLTLHQGRDIPAAAVGGPAFPGRGHFRPGQSNKHVEKLGRQLVKRGFGKHYTSGPGPRWSEADRRNVEAFQRAQGWRGGAADGYPGPETWRRLFR
ncbi:peptidoglycan-binding protein [Streptomyces purpureus]|uniref:peptidoglycan-binding protein n=1 Tax=Streptomyces purpureus TaxID=1951 RepID=UPI0037A2776D